MKAVLQRVLSASVECEGKTVSEIGKGFMVLLGVTKTDTQAEADILASKIAGLRIFEDENGKMNLSLDEVGGKIIVVSNFTLCADCKHGKRPSFINAQRPVQANELYEYFIKKLKFYGVPEVGTGVFGGDMQVHIQNDGPVTLILDTDDWK
ncbi:MAG: D-tyrosyl-tRNA(Tyr) deacylase [Oscillospiraceae bacterium]|nr:D-tyrosyl-tRNA(Tyr) deacylase [Oscillospiraceae bacterium]MBP1574360.1 D-tyrosyl-tRNA(Tyr) deacylase [Oscillospiraceae bacterium]MBQ5323502.1 D-tyrosyl-tRNA(Tyr) deacylase [Oscillospiraceae bacterium]MBQ8594744.1 D-tyrosyl-tRNA(Tyr) deacylase [Oscillospiraceae bacterium]